MPGRASSSQGVPMPGFSLYARFLGASEIYARITSGSAASIGVVRPLGFQHVQEMSRIGVDGDSR